MRKRWIVLFASLYLNCLHLGFPKTVMTDEFYCSIYPFHPSGAAGHPPEGPRGNQETAERSIAQADDAEGQREETDAPLRHPAGARAAPPQGERQAEGREQPHAGLCHPEDRLPAEIQGRETKSSIPPTDSI